LLYGLNIFNKLIKTITIKDDLYKKLTLVAYLKVSMIILTTLNHKKRGSIGFNTEEKEEIVTGIQQKEEGIIDLLHN
jgi:predicted CopG family antitoxin